MKRLISLIFLLGVMVTLLSGCGSNVTGKYYVKTYLGKPIEEELQEEAEHFNKSLQEYLDELGISSPREAYILEIKSDGTWYLNIAFEGYGSGGGTWKQEGNKITLKVHGVVFAECTINGNEITASTGDENHKQVLVYSR